MKAILIKAPHLRAAGLLTILSMLMLGCHAGAEPEADSTSLPPAQPASSASHDDGALPSIQRIDLEEAWSLFNGGAAIFVDVRPRQAYDAAHIPGALSIPFGVMNQSLDGIDPDTAIITYCT